MKKIVMILMTTLISLLITSCAITSYSSDEDRFGFTYKELNDLIRNGVKGEHYEKIMSMYNRGKFKIENIRLPYYDPGLPINSEFVL